MVAHQPASVELLDDMLIRLSRENLDTQRYCHFIEGNPGSVLLVEFFEMYEVKHFEKRMHCNNY